MRNSLMRGIIRNPELPFRNRPWRLQVVALCALAAVFGCSFVATRLGPVAGAEAENGCYPTALQHDRVVPVLLEPPVPRDGSATVVGTVADFGSGFAVPDVVVRLRLLSHSEVLESRTSFDGGFSFRGLLPGQYELTALRALHRPLLDTIASRANSVVARSYRMQAFSHCR